jgi:hypothetical protein
MFNIKGLFDPVAERARQVVTSVEEALISIEAEGKAIIEKAQAELRVLEGKRALLLQSSSDEADAVKAAEKEIAVMREQAKADEEAAVQAAEKEIAAQAKADEAEAAQAKADEEAAAQAKADEEAAAQAKKKAK